MSVGKSRFVDVNGLRLHFLEYGCDVRGAPIVVVPGITSPAATWEFVSVELARDGRVFALDVRGRGLSDKPAAGFTLPDYARDIAEALPELGLGCPVLLGHSMGARIVAAFAALYPGRAAAVIVADPPLTGPGRGLYPTPVESFVESIRAARAGATADDMRPYFPAWTDEQLAQRAKWLATCDETAVVETYRLFHEEDFLDYWRRVEPPALFLWGGASPVVDASGAAEAAAANPAAESTCLEGAGHMLPWDDLEGFLAAVRDFLIGVARARP